MTNEQLADSCLLAAKVLQDTGSFETGQAILRDASARIRELDAALTAKRDDLTCAIFRADVNELRADRAEAALATARDAGLEVAAKVAESYDYSLQSTTDADIRARMITAAIRALKGGDA